MAMLREGFRYTVKFVKKRNTKIGIVTDFQIGEKLNNNEWINFRCTALSDIDIADNDRVKITHIGSVEVKEYNNKIYYNAVVDVERLDEPARYEDTGTSDEPFDL
jgi:hypothetical protein